MQSWNSPKTSSMTGDMRKEAVTRAAARIMKVRAPEVTIAVAVFRFCRSMSPWRLGCYQCVYHIVYTMPFCNWDSVASCNK